MLESHPPDVRVMEETLELAGLPAQVTCVSSPDEVLFAAEDDSLDIALLNLQLPDVDPTIVDELRSLDGAKRLPIIAFSDEHPEHADHVFPKPEHEAEYMGIVAAIRFYWMSAAPSLPPPAPVEPEREEDGGSEDAAEHGSVRPQRKSGIDLMGLPIEPVEAYLLSMVDGTMGVDEISLSIGAEVKETRAMLRRLSGLGVVSWRAPHPSLAPPPPPSIAPPPSASSILSGVGLRRPMRLTVDSFPKEAPPMRGEMGEVTPETARGTAELGEVESTLEAPGRAAEPDAPEDAPPKSEAPADSEAAPTEGTAERRVISDERKKMIDDAHALLGEADHYELLGVPRDAEKSQIRSEYFKLAKLFHTDSLYGVELAEYGSKMDQVFQAITEAYEVLGKKKKRRAYDAYLGAVSETASLEAPRHTKPPARPSVIPKASAEDDQRPRQVHQGHSGSPERPSAKPQSSGPRSSPKPESSKPQSPKAQSSKAQSSKAQSSKPQSPKPQSSKPQPIEAQSSTAQSPSAEAKRPRRSEGAGHSRREIGEKLLARRTGRQAAPPPQPPQAPQAPQAPQPPQSSKQQAGSAAPKAKPPPKRWRKDRAARLIEDARVAEERGNITGAAEALRIASAWRPHDAALAKDAERLRQAALVEKAPAFAKRARYAEKNGKWEEAATCWARVADVRPEDHAALRSAAGAMVKARGDMKQAAAYAKRAVQLAPKDAECHQILAEVWIGAGMPTSAKRCLETALRLNPKNRKASSLLEQLRG